MSDRDLSEEIRLGHARYLDDCRSGKRPCKGRRSSAVTKEKSLSIDLGLAVIEAVTPPGFRWNLRDIADVCGCHFNNIYLIEQKALKKLRNRLLFSSAPAARELREEFGR